ncbi:MAG: hypothetical protein MI919_23390, partial [Holophagales bacterium]|nr:hypothetical protein [Holophagales bacterium]
MKPMLEMDRVERLCRDILSSRDSCGRFEGKKRGGQVSLAAGQGNRIRGGRQGRVCRRGPAAPAPALEERAGAALRSGAAVLLLVLAAPAQTG